MLSAPLRWIRSLRGDRRQAKRYVAPESLAIVARLEAIENPGIAVLGYVRNLSEAGIALDLADCRISDYDISRPGTPLRVIVALPVVTIQLKVVTVRCDLIREQPKRNLLAVTIVLMSATDRAILMEFLTTLK